MYIHMNPYLFVHTGTHTHKSQKFIKLQKSTYERRDVSLPSTSAPRCLSRSRVKRQTGEKSLSCAPLLFLHMLLNFSSGSKTPMQHFFYVSHVLLFTFQSGEFCCCCPSWWSCCHHCCCCLRKLYSRNRGMRRKDVNPTHWLPSVKPQALWLLQEATPHISKSLWSLQSKCMLQVIHLCSWRRLLLPH